MGSVTSSWKRNPLILPRSTHSLAGIAGNACPLASVQHRKYSNTECVRQLRVEVVADDLFVVGFGDTDEEAARDHDQNLDAILQCCKEKNIKLNEKKVD